MQSILMVVGTRPEAIKLIPIIYKLRSLNRKLYICSTGQHKELLDQVFTLFNITPDIYLDVMRHGQTPADVIGNILHKMQQTISDTRPDWVIVHGDTATALAAALVSFYQRTNVAHIEAGLRTYNLMAPWPEELQRRLISVLTTKHFTPTDAATAALLAEGVDKSRIHQVGNTGIDTLLEMQLRIRNSKSLRSELENKFNYLIS